jgi:hypothetical protein
MRIDSGQPGVLACVGDSCSESLCVAGDEDYFLTWKYEGLPVFKSSSFSWKVIVSVIILVASVVVFGAIIGTLIMALVYFMTRFWGVKDG